MGLPSISQEQMKMIFDQFKTETNNYIQSKKDESTSKTK
jgi:hypothetical protein